MLIDVADPGGLGDGDDGRRGAGAESAEVAASRDRSVPCEGVTETVREPTERGSLSLAPFTSAASTVERLVTVIVHVIRSPTATVVGDAVFDDRRGRAWRPGGGAVGAGMGRRRGEGLRRRRLEAALPRFVNVQTTTSPRPTVPSTFVPGTRSRPARSACTRPPSRSRQGSSRAGRLADACPHRRRRRVGRSSSRCRPSPRPRSLILSWKTPGSSAGSTTLRSSTVGLQAGSSADAVAV